MKNFGGRKAFLGIQFPRTAARVSTPQITVARCPAGKRHIRVFRSFDPKPPFWADYGKMGDGCWRAGPFETPQAAEAYALANGGFTTPMVDGWYIIMDSTTRTMKIMCDECLQGPPDEA